jgi:hypothetical protein
VEYTVIGNNPSPSNMPAPSRPGCVERAVSLLPGFDFAGHPKLIGERGCQRVKIDRANRCHAGTPTRIRTEIDPGLKPGAYAVLLWGLVHWHQYRIL